MGDVVTLVLALALCLQTFNVSRLSRRLKLLEKATAHLTPDHRLDALAGQVNALGARTVEAFGRVHKVLDIHNDTDAKLLLLVEKLRAEAEKPGASKDHMH